MSAHVPPVPDVGAARTASDGAAPATLRTILFPSDLTPASDRAFEHARLLAERFGARLTLCHFVAGRLRDDHPLPDEVWESAQQVALQHLNELAQGRGVSHRSAVYEGYDIPRALVRHIRANTPDLTVMATHGRTGLAHFVLGSVAEEVLRHEAGPVLCIREPEHGVALPYRRILLPTDLSEGSRRALPWVVLLARAFGAEVVALHAAAFPTLTSVSEVRAFLEPDLCGLRLIVRVPWGPAEEAILAAAREEKADLIVMATRGHDSLGDRLRGTHTERLIRLAPCPVLALPETTQ